MSVLILRAHEFIRNTKLELNKLELIEGMQEIKLATKYKHRLTDWLTDWWTNTKCALYKYIVRLQNFCKPIFTFYKCCLVNAERFVAKYTVNLTFFFSSLPLLLLPLLLLLLIFFLLKFFILLLGFYLPTAKVYISTRHEGDCKEEEKKCVC